MTKRSGEGSPHAHSSSGRAGRDRNATAGTAARPLRVLVVDDDRVDRLALRRALQQTDFDVTVGEADGVLAAIDLLGAEKFDCVLLDYNLPDGDGLTFLRGLRGAGISATVIMITAQPDDAVAAELMSAGAADYIPKALFTPGLLSSSLQRLFGTS
ncbi:MAG TPA: response regulator [Thermoanaerobaculia bacterium]|jgi:CheY-like chemotaxis protein